MCCAKKTRTKKKKEKKHFVLILLNIFIYVCNKYKKKEREREEEEEEKLNVLKVIFFIFERRRRECSKYIEYTFYIIISRLEKKEEESISHSSDSINDYTTKKCAR